MDVMIKLATLMRDLMIKEIVKIAKSALTHKKKMVEHVKPDAMMTTRLSKRMEHVRYVQFTLTQIHLLR